MTRAPRSTSELPSGSAAGYMADLHVPSGIADFSPPRGQPATKHLVVVATAVAA